MSKSSRGGKAADDKRNHAGASQAGLAGQAPPPLKTSTPVSAQAAASRPTFLFSPTSMLANNSTPMASPRPTAPVVPRASAGVVDPLGSTLQRWGYPALVVLLFVLSSILGVFVTCSAHPIIGEHYLDLSSEATCARCYVTFEVIVAVAAVRAVRTPAHDISPPLIVDRVALAMEMLCSYSPATSLISQSLPIASLTSQASLVVVLLLLTVPPSLETEFLVVRQGRVFNVCRQGLRPALMRCPLVLGALSHGPLPDPPLPVTLLFCPSLSRSPLLSAWVSTRQHSPPRSLRSPGRSPPRPPPATFLSKPVTPSATNSRRRAQHTQPRSLNNRSGRAKQSTPRQSPLRQRQPRLLPRRSWASPRSVRHAWRCGRARPTTEPTSRMSG